MCVCMYCSSSSVNVVITSSVICSIMVINISIEIIISISIISIGINRNGSVQTTYGSLGADRTREAFDPEFHIFVVRVFCASRRAIRGPGCMRVGIVIY